MARPAGSPNKLTGLTYFFTQSDKPSQVLCQVMIVYSTSGHWQITSYEGGEKVHNAKRVPYWMALEASGIPEVTFREIFRLPVK